MMRYTKFFALIVLLASSIPVFAYDIEVDGIYYNIIDEEAAEVTSGAYSGKVVIPASITYESREIPVVSIGNNAFYWCDNITNIEIPASVTSFGESAFAWCKGLASIEIPNSVTSIGNFAFSGCSAITGIVIPESVISLGEFAFSRCSSLASVEIPASLTSLENGVFSHCSSLPSIEIPGSIISIGEEVFYECRGLTHIEIPNSVISIGPYAFENCNRLSSIELPNSVLSVGGYAFSLCSSLTNVTIGENITEIGRNAFESCESIKEITVYAIEPPTAYENCFESIIYEKSCLYVPQESIIAYKMLNPWSKFSNIEYIPAPDSGVEGMEININHVVDIFSLQGVCVKQNATQHDIDALRPGVYIIDGKKVIVK